MTTSAVYGRPDLVATLYAGETFYRYTQRDRPRGTCPRGTPGCRYADCSGLFGKSCYGPNAPMHMDMGV